MVRCAREALHLYNILHGSHLSTEVLLEIGIATSQLFKSDPHPPRW